MDDKNLFKWKKVSPSLPPFVSTAKGKVTKPREPMDPYFREKYRVPNVKKKK